jgi:hypothetical protein
MELSIMFCFSKKVNSLILLYNLNFNFTKSKKIIWSKENSFLTEISEDENFPENPHSFDISLLSA